MKEYLSMLYACEHVPAIALKRMASSWDTILRVMWAYTETEVPLFTGAIDPRQ